MFVHFSRKRDEWSEREGGTRSHWATLRNWNWTLRGLCGYLVCLTDAAVPALFPLPEQSTPRIAVRSSITAHTNTHTHTHTWKKEINESYANVVVDDSHCCCALSVSLCVSFALLCAAQLEIGTRWRGHRLDALSGNAALCICSQRMSAHFQLVCNTACPCANDFIVGPRKKEQQNEVTTPHRITKTRQQSRKQKQATIITDHPQSMA